MSTVSPSLWAFPEVRRRVHQKTPTALQRKTEPNLIAKNQAGDLLLLSDFSKKFDNLSISHFGTQLPSHHDQLCRSFSPNTNETNIYQRRPTRTSGY
jgi:hypothetical protein